MGSDVVSEDDVVESEVDGGPVREVGDDESIWRSSKERKDRSESRAPRSDA